jgi:hypothetical protein
VLCRTPGVGVSPTEAAKCYRLYAAWCAEFAKRAPDLGRKAALLDLAQRWLRLAEQVCRQDATTDPILDAMKSIT